MNKQRINNLSRTLIVILSYFIYTKLLFTLFEIFNLGNPYENWIFSFISDIIYFAFIFYLYRRTFVSDIGKLKKDFWKKFLLGIKWLLIAIVLQTIAVGIVKTFIDGLVGNEAAIINLPIIYMIFKTMVFSIVVEEIVFKKSIRDVISNDKLFIVVSSVFYGLMNVAYTELGSTIELLVILPYIVSSAIMGILYIKTDNILLVMLVKFTYNLLPLTAVLLGWL
jgi:membrane protease YdiL (CAAX protease family)